MYYYNKELEKAIDSYEKALEIDPTFANRWNNLGNVYYDKKEYDKAFECYEKAFELDPNYKIPKLL